MRTPPLNKRALAEADWPEIDRKAWAAAQTPDADLLGGPQPASRWRASSKELHCRCYGLWLAWLSAEGLFDGSQLPGDRVTPERLRNYLRAQRAMGSGARTLVNHAVGLRHMFEALSPEREWRWMLPVIEKLKTAVQGSSNHSDLPTIRELFELGVGLMRRAESPQGGTPKQRAVMFRNGLAIAILAARPMMRRNNLATIRVGKQLTREGDVYHLHFSGEEMKGRRRRGGPLPVILTWPLDRYIEHERRVLLGSKADPDGILFISAMGLPIYPHAFSHEIGKVTEAAFGRRLTTHKFRHAAANGIAKQDPEHAGIILTVLGHSDYRTSERFYVFADEQAAFMRLEKAIAQLLLDDRE